MAFDATQISHLQSCSRRFLLESEWQVLRWRPKSLFDASLRRGILDISQGHPPADVAKERVADFLQAAASPGLDIPRGGDSYKIAMDWAAMLQTTVRAAARWGLPRLMDMSEIPLRINGTQEWRVLAFQAPDEKLHRVVTMDRWDEAAMQREAHGWYVAGDMAVAGWRGMTVHVVEIGRMRDGRRASPWARGWQHPEMYGQRIKFARKDKGSFKGWDAVYLADEPQRDPGEWVEQLYVEGVAQALTHHVEIPPPTEAQRAETLRQMLVESARARVLISERGSASWRALPMARGSCDSLVPCPWQGACYAETDTRLDTTGLYVIRDKSTLYGSRREGNDVHDNPAVAGVGVRAE